MNSKVAPFLMFEGKAEEAMKFYVSLIPNSRIVEVTKYGPEEAGPEGSIMVATFEIDGLRVMCSDSPIEHGFSFTPSTSLFVTCSDEDEIQRLSPSLGEGGEFLMPLDDYGFSRKFTWVKDRFGVSWQLNLA